jgi:hypothetical protein
LIDGVPHRRDQAQLDIQAEPPRALEHGRLRQGREGLPSSRSGCQGAVADPADPGHLTSTRRGVRFR